MHNARVFANLTLCNGSLIPRLMGKPGNEANAKGQIGSLLPHWTENVGGTDVPLVLLGHPVYPLLPWHLKVDDGQLKLSYC